MSQVRRLLCFVWWNGSAATAKGRQIRFQERRNRGYIQPQGGRPCAIRYTRRLLLCEMEARHYLRCFYNYKIPNQDTPEVLERQWKKHKAEQRKQNSEVTSNASTGCRVLWFGVRYQKRPHQLHISLSLASRSNGLSRTSISNDPYERSFARHVEFDTRNRPTQWW